MRAAAMAVDSGYRSQDVYDHCRHYANKHVFATKGSSETGKPVYEDETLEFEAMPYIVVVVDEVADLMMVSGKEIEGAVQRLAQMARY
jgi:S-DNA-T family DNA segregation ATPase FtsK/SpoIIIE